MTSASRRDDSGVTVSKSMMRCRAVRSGGSISLHCRRCETREPGSELLREPQPMPIIGNCDFACFPSDSCDDEQTAKGVERPAVGSDRVRGAQAPCVFFEEQLALLVV